MEPIVDVRRSLRLPGYDYGRPGSYFVTICNADRKCSLGKIVDEEMSLSATGEIARDLWQSLPERHEALSLDEFVVMPNHIHGIIELTEHCQKVPSVVGAYKSLSTKAINVANATPGGQFWQRSYHEHVIRDERARDRIREYIRNNPLKWHLDRENPVISAAVRRAGRAPPLQLDRLITPCSSANSPPPS
ncbi:MAG TPA: transposase [Stellaceae bacterium]|nr:transposase [Stellaceae bacterium]